MTPTTARLLRHWRNHPFANQRLFFCQIEAVEPVIWLTEVASRSSSQGRRFWTHLEAPSSTSNPELMCMALKLATGTGETNVISMLIAWQTLNAVRHPNAKRFSKDFLVVAAGTMINDRLHVLQPNDPESNYNHRDRTERHADRSRQLPITNCGCELSNHEHPGLTECTHGAHT